jgi:pyruvate,water dikinase
MSRPYPNDGQPSPTFPIYSRGNLGEAFPNVISPMTGSLMLEASTRAQTRWFLETGALSRDQVNAPANAMFVQFYGYLYANASLARIAAVRAPGMRVDDIDVQYGGVGVLPPYRPRRGDRSLVATLRMGRFASRAFRSGDAERARAAQREVDSWVSSLSPVRSASDADLLTRVRQASRWFERMLPEMMTVTLHAGASRIVIERMAAAAGQPDAANAITSGFGGVASASPPIALWDLGRQVRQSSQLQNHFGQGVEGLDRRLRTDPECVEFVEAFDAFLRRFGYHGADELELASPKWGTDPDLALRIVERLREAPDDRDPAEAAQTLKANRFAATARVRQKLRGPRRLLFDRAVGSASLYVPERENTKAALVRALFEARRALNELARRHLRRHLPPRARRARAGSRRSCSVRLDDRSTPGPAQFAPAAGSAVLVRAPDLRPGRVAAPNRPRPEPGALDRGDDAGSGTRRQRGRRHRSRASDPRPERTR